MDNQINYTGHVSVIGLGFVGLTLAVFLASKGIRVTGIERDNKKVDQLRSGNPTFFESGLSEVFTEVIIKGHLTIISTDEMSDLERLDTYINFITVGTPLQDNEPDMSQIENVIEKMWPILEPESIFALRSTVTPGTVQNLKNKFFDRFEITFCPERTIEGNALAELQNLPQIIGADSENATRKLQNLFDHCGVDCVTVTTEEAELVKLFSNVYRDLHFGIANLFAEICHEKLIIPENVLAACAWNYPRAKIPAPGFVAGPCLIKDAKLLSSSIDSCDLSSFILMGRSLHKRQLSSCETMISSLPPESKIVFTGMAFKGYPETDDMRDSPAIEILNLVVDNEKNHKIFLHDFVVPFPQLQKLQKEEYNNQIIDYVFILNNHKYYQNQSFLERMNYNFTSSTRIINLWGGER